ncbi:MAG: hypothetical protein IJT94_13250, partial [Oscillibacter sp.]|nr:hypothetical protein [Oscillibacter sp.]
MEQEKQIAEERRKQFLRKLEQKARKAQLEAKLVSPEGEGEREALHVLLPVTGEGGVCLMELMAVPFVDGTDMLIFYTTVLEEAGPGRDALNAVLSEWNLACPMGAFGLFRADGGEQLFHKYST